jgi:LAO/AO transport system kinase
LDLNSPSVAAVRELAAAIRDGSSRALSRGLTWIEAGGERAEALIELVYAASAANRNSEVQIVGVTGSAGAGKSTLVSALAKEASRRGLSIGVLAVDPSSPFTGGAILGDRVRMSDLSGDEGVFIRSMAARGELGGLSKAAAAGIDLMRAAGKQLVLVETVGVGQDEVDVMRVAHTTILVSVPGMGDDVQMLKAGLFEIADIHVVNKADREGAGETAAHIRAMLALNQDPDEQWHPPVLETVAPKNDGVPALLDAVTSHMAWLRESSELQGREREMAEWRVLKLAQSMVAETIRRPGSEPASLHSYFDRVARRELSPYACARALLNRATSKG